MNRIIECRLDSTYKEIYTGIWQHDYGQILRITGADLPKAVEVQFSLEDNGGDTLTRIGTTADGATEVKVPDSFLKNTLMCLYLPLNTMYLQNSPALH